MLRRIIAPAAALSLTLCVIVSCSVSRESSPTKAPDRPVAVAAPSRDTRIAENQPQAAAAEKPEASAKTRHAEPAPPKLVRLPSETVVTTGIRASVQQSMTQKRTAVPTIEGVTAEDVGKMPEKNVADSLQRVSGVGAPPPPMVALSMPYLPAPAPIAAQDTARYQHIERHGILRVSEAPVSTFSIDVDTGSYSNVRHLLNNGLVPPRDAVRVEEMVNYFPYQYPLPRDDKPFAASTEIAPTPWNPDTLLLRIGIQAADPAKESLPPANLTFLIDISGSMQAPDRLPLLRNALKLLVDQLRPQDRVSLVTYAGDTHISLEPTSGKEKAKIKAAIDSLEAGGSTAGAAGIQLAYQMAQQGFIKGGINRILLATDGDFNVGITRFETLKDMVAEKRKSGISLSTLGFGTDNYNDQLMEQLADAGDGAYSFIDTLGEAQKVLVNEFTSTLATVAHDVKIQLEFNPAVVAEYRQIGFEDRALKREDFNNDKVDAGEIGAGHRVTALYEITLVGKPESVDPLRYAAAATTDEGKRGELGFLRLRYKEAHGEASKLLEFPIERSAIKKSANADFNFAAAVAAFGQLMSDDGKYLGKFGFPEVEALAAASRGDDRFGYRGDFLQVVKLAESLSTKPKEQ